VDVYVLEVLEEVDELEEPELAQFEYALA